MGGTEAFPTLGKHCSHEDCHLLDFLPFKCDGCSHVFCSDHRTYSAHSCPRGYSSDLKVFFCPLCQATLKSTREEAVRALKQHQGSSSCDPKNADAKKRHKCPVKGCKEVLTTSNTAHCRDCGKKICLRHRFAADHKCGFSGPRQTPDMRNLAYIKALARSQTSCGAEERLSPKNRSPSETSPPRDIGAH